jgi:hypothetical protein
MEYGADRLFARYGCESMVDVHEILAEVGHRTGFSPWQDGRLENVTFADGIELPWLTNG